MNIGRKEMTGMKALVGKRITKKVAFMGDKVEISKLTLSEVTSIQDFAKEAENDDSKGLELLKMVIRMSVEGASDLTDDDFNTFPLEEISSIAEQVMSFSGMRQEDGKK
jgi:hypothetical protein